MVNLGIRRTRSVEAKGDGGPGEWMPPNRGYWCSYDLRFATVLAKYHLRVIAADATAITAVLGRCP
jgi:hypothetical protein